jgi:integrase
MPRRVQDWRGAIRGAGCSAGQANMALGILSTALSAARRARKLPANPCQGIRRLKVDVARPHALTPLEVERIRAQLVRPIDAALVSVLAFGGLRPQEAFPLRWRGVGRTIVVSRTWTHGELRERTKTGSIRAVEIVDPLAADLEAIRPKVSAPDDLVFPSPTGLLLDLHNWRDRIFKPAARAAGVEAVPYDLRHTFVSLLIHQGCSVPYVAAMAGTLRASALSAARTRLRRGAARRGRPDGRSDPRGAGRAECATRVRCASAACERLERESHAVQGFREVEDTGLEPVTSTLPA